MKLKYNIKVWASFAFSWINQPSQYHISFCKPCAYKHLKLNVWALQPSVPHFLHGAPYVLCWCLQLQELLEPQNFEQAQLWLKFLTALVHLDSLKFTMCFCREDFSIQLLLLYRLKSAVRGYPWNIALHLFQKFDSELTVGTIFHETQRSALHFLLLSNLAQLPRIRYLYHSLCLYYE